MSFRNGLLRGSLAVGLVAVLGLAVAQEQGLSIAARMQQWRQHDIKRPKPTVVEPASPVVSTPPPKDAVVLFDGSDLDAWEGAEGGKALWKVADGAFEVTPGRGGIQTKAKFGDIQLHVEWASPNPPNGKGQDRGNSGLFFMGVYELQILDSYKAETYADGQAGAIYGQYPPLANATRPPGEWQAYDVAFRRPRFDKAGKLIEPARMTVFLNGILVQNNEELFGQTNWLRWVPYQNVGDKAAISLQDHGHPVKFRNFWVRELPERPTPTTKDRTRDPVVTLSAEALARFAGRYVPAEKPDSPPIVIARQGGNLTVRFPFRNTSLEMEPVAATVFDLPRTDGRFTFQLDADGQVTGVRFQIGDGERNLRRVK